MMAEQTGDPGRLPPGLTQLPGLPDLLNEPEQTQYEVARLLYYFRLAESDIVERAMSLATKPSSEPPTARQQQRLCEQKELYDQQYSQQAEAQMQRPPEQRPPDAVDPALPAATLPTRELPGKQQQQTPPAAPPAAPHMTLDNPAPRTHADAAPAFGLAPDWQQTLAQTYSTPAGFKSSKLPMLPPDIPLRALAPKADGGDARPVMTKDVHADGPTLLLLLRRPGCLLCRQWASSLQSHRQTINGYGVRMVAIVKEDVGIEGFVGSVWSDPVLLDPEHSLYRFINDGELRVATVWQLVSSSAFWSSISTASKAGFVNNFEGEGYILGGMIVVSQQGEVVYMFSEQVPGETPPIQDVLDACASFGPVNNDLGVYLQIGGERARIG